MPGGSRSIGSHPTACPSHAVMGPVRVYWPPSTGAPTAGPGVTGKLGTIKRSDGSLQATYDGHPLYTYIGDSARARLLVTGST